MNVLDEFLKEISETDICAKESCDECGRKRRLLAIVERQRAELVKNALRFEYLFNLTEEEPGNCKIFAEETRTALADCDRIAKGEG